MKWSHRRMAGVAVSLLLGCGLLTDGGPAAAKSQQQSVGAVARATNAFGARLLSEMVGPNGDRTVVLSPYGLSATLNLLALGAEGRELGRLRRPLGPTDLSEPAIAAGHKAIRNLLSASIGPGIEVETASSAWLAPRLKASAEFRSSAEDTFGAAVAVADFAGSATLAVIDKWASEATRGLIPEIVADIDRATELVLVNAVYFKGRWATAFDAKSTTPAPFTRADGSKREVPMMAERLTINYARGPDFHAVALPYVGGRFRLIVLTAEDAARSTALWQRMTGKSAIAETLAALKFRAQEVDVRLPRFRAELSASLTGSLGKLGLADALGGRVRYARLSRERFSTLEVIQRAVLDVNESGTEAAAVTAALGSRSLGDGAPQFSADRPFLVALSDSETGVFLFLGYIADP